MFGQALNQGVKGLYRRVLLAQSSDESTARAEDDRRMTRGVVVSKTEKDESILMFEKEI
jgi:hypothetical protein